MTFILGMDLFVFIAWLGTILAAIFCVLYGIYYELIKKSNIEDKKENLSKLNKKSKKEA